MDYSLENLEKLMKEMIDKQVVNDDSRSFGIFTGEKGARKFHASMLISQLYKIKELSLDEKRKIAKMIDNDDEETYMLGKQLYLEAKQRYNYDIEPGLED